MIDKRILYFDIETSLMKAVTFGVGKYNMLTHKHLLSKTKIICLSYRFHGDTKTTSLVWDRDQDDKKLLVAFNKVYDKADVTIGQNHKKFDTRHINTRLCDHNLPPMNIVLIEDLLIAAKSSLNLPSYSLEYMLRYFNLPHKIQTSGLDLWIDVGINDDRKRLMSEMVPYCENDTEILQPLYEKISPYVKLKYNRAIAEQNPELCSSCGHNKLHVKGYKQTTTLGIRLQKVCLKCGKHQTTGQSYVKTLSDQPSSKYLRG